ncbi:MAG: winged helix-turn-helix domain-containing protein [Vicinamibacterales bacterium]
MSANEAATLGSDCCALASPAQTKQINVRTRCRTSDPEGEVVGRGEIAEDVWDTAFESMSNVIDVMIQRLRRKIDPPAGPSLIVTRRGEGYMLVRTAAGDAG